MGVVGVLGGGRGLIHPYVTISPYWTTRANKLPYDIVSQSGDGPEVEIWKRPMSVGLPRLIFAL